MKNCTPGYAADTALAELNRAMTKFPNQHTSAHEMYAVILEELDEAWDAIKANDIQHAHKEMVQVAAMALRFLVEVPT